MSKHACIERVNKALAPHNTELLPCFSFEEGMPERIAVATMKVDGKKRGQPKLLFATWCPFCGERL